MKRITIITAVIASLSLSACGLHRQTGFSDVLSASHSEPYTLGTGDRLRVIVFGQDGLSNTYTVDTVGMVSIPLIGTVNANGQTTRGLEQAIIGKLRTGFLRDPKVSVEIDQFRPFFILGEVTTSGQFQYVNGMTVQTAVAIAGGFQPRANRHAADITRVIGGEVVTGRVPLDSPVRPGDTVTIRERFF
jgi:polysaccharide biosynthesis/export protein